MCLSLRADNMSIQETPLCHVSSRRYFCTFVLISHPGDTSVPMSYPDNIFVPLSPPDDTYEHVTSRRQLYLYPILVTPL